ncbi:MAG: hypothetical protein UHD09_06170 [Bifidobacterium sp.]|nr:hypothetical protein [Bifidobacterium sp.]
MDKALAQEEKKLAKAESILTPEEKKEAVAGARRNDLRLLLGVLFTIYGVIVTCVGIFNPNDGMDKTGGIAINLWTGIIMLIVGVAFLIWNFARPIPEEDIIESAEESARHVAQKDQTMSSEIHQEAVNQELRVIANDEARADDHRGERR